MDATHPRRPIVNVCTIIAKNYLAHARVLTASFLEHHPDGRCFVLVIDDFEGVIDPGAEQFTLVSPADIGVEAWDDMRAAYDVLELSTAVKPWLMRHLLREHDDGSGTVYLDPDIQVHSRMTELEELLRRRSIVVTPHVTRGMPRDGKKPSELDILLAGVYNLGFLGLASGGDAEHLLGWWADRLVKDCHVAPERGLFVDQRWMDFVPGLVEDLAILRDTSYNVAYWNLPERLLDAGPDGTVRVDGRPLRFFHFSGYSPSRRDILSRHQTRVQLSDDEVLRRLCDDYADALEDAGLDDVQGLPYTHDVLPSGLRLTRLLRSLYRAGVEAGEISGSVFTAAGETDFVRWLNEPDADDPGISRFLKAAWSGRQDLVRAYPDPGGADREGFLGWCDVFGREQIGIPDVLLPVASAEPPARRPRTGTGSARQAQGRALPYGVNVAGYLRSELGIGEVARQLIHALDCADIPAIPVGLLAPLSRQGHRYAVESPQDNHFAINLICVNADGLPAFADQAGDDFFADRYNIGFWWWETSSFPERYHEAFDLVDEVWVGSDFVARTLSEVSPVPVVHMPAAVDVPQAPPLRPGELGLPDAFRFGFSFDYNSVFERKNPLGLVEAYTQAFGPDDGAALVIKCINGDQHAGRHAALRDAVADRADIVLIDDYLDPGDKDRLMASFDCYVSLHRSEGFGLTIAEAMLLGKPVIATAYSGNMDFTTPANSYLVDYELVPIGTGARPYPAGGEWAQPDLRQAATLMRRVFEDRDEAAAKGIRAAADLRERHAPAVVGQALEGRLRRIASQLERRRAAGREDQALTQARELVARAGRPNAPSRFGKAGGAARRALLRAMRPYTAYQAQVNATLLAQTERLLEAEREGAAQQEARLATSLARMAASQRRQERELSRRLDELRRELADGGRERAQRDQLLRDSERLVQETRAIPYMSSDPFETFEAGAAGRVLGYARAEGNGHKSGYQHFEDLFRGSEDFIRARQRRYLELLDDTAGPALDVGCGRGEFLDLLAEAGIPAVGVDLDRGMVERCREKGHEVVLGDAVEHLRGLEDESLGLIFAAQVVEHLEPQELEELLGLAGRKLRPDGRLIAETVNPHSVAAMKAFWVDITHQHPLFPETMLALCRIAGFRSAYVFHPYGAGDVDADRYTTGEYAVVARRLPAQVPALEA